MLAAALARPLAGRTALRAASASAAASAAAARSSAFSTSSSSSSSSSSLTSSSSLASRCGGLHGGRGPAAPPPCRCARCVGTRGFASAAAKTPLELQVDAAEPRLKFPGAAGAIARLWFVLGGVKNVREQLAESFEAIAAAIAASEPLRDALSSPVIEAAAVTRLIDALVSSSDAATAAMIKTLLLDLVAQKRLKHLEKACRYYALMMNDHRGIIVANVTTSRKLSAADLARLDATLKRYFVGNDKTLKLEVNVDPSLVGGLRLELGEKLFDLSLASQLSRMQTQIDAIRRRAAEETRTVMPKLQWTSN